jgi:hypothetical protein
MAPQSNDANGQLYADENASVTAEKQKPGVSKDVFVEDEAHQIQYKTLSWQVRLSLSFARSKTIDQNSLSASS